MLPKQFKNHLLYTVDIEATDRSALAPGIWAF